MKQFIGTCVSNPFRHVAALSAVIEAGREITRTRFFRVVGAGLDTKTKEDMRRFPRDYRFFQAGPVFFFEWSRIEHFYQ